MDELIKKLRRSISTEWDRAAHATHDSHGASSSSVAVIDPSGANPSLPGGGLLKSSAEVCLSVCPFLSLSLSLSLERNDLSLSRT